MNVTALGTNAAYAAPGNACSGWLLQDGGANVLLDCGTGVLSRLQEFLPLTAITAIVISHMHADHFFDLVPLRQALQYGPNGNHSQPELYLPPGGTQALHTVSGVLHPDYAADFFERGFKMREYRVGEAVQTGNLEFTFAAGVHYVPAWSMAARSLDRQGHRVTYTGDTGPSQAVTELAHGSDLLITEATYLSLNEEHGAVRGHMTAREAGELAAASGAHRTLLTHQWPHRKPDQALEQAETVLRGPVASAQVGASYTV